LDIIAIYMKIQADSGGAIYGKLNSLPQHQKRSHLIKYLKQFDFLGLKKGAGQNARRESNGIKYY